jgi:hypothetical protein
VVLRHGRVAGERAVARTTREEIVGLITGDLADGPPPRAKRAPS